LWKLYQHDLAIEQHRSELAASARHTERLKTDQADAEKRHEEGKRELASLHRDLLRGERALKKKQHAIEDQKPSLVSIDEKISHTERSLRNLRSKKDSVDSDQKGYETSVKTLQRDLDTVRKAANKFEDDQKKLAQQKGIALSDADQAEYRKLKEESIKQAASEKAKLDSLNRQLRTETEVFNNSKTKSELLDVQKKSVSEEIRLHTEKVHDLTAKVNTLTQDVANKRKELDTAKSDRTRRELKKTELNEKLQTCLNRIQQMNYDRRETEREALQRETLATLKRVFPAVRGRVSDLCKPTQKRYTIAVETILGRHMNSVVVDTEKCATECINYLSSARLPVRTFIPLDTIMTKPVNANLRSIHRNAKLGIDVVNYDRVHERAMAYVFGNAVVCDDYNVAREITVSRGHEVKCVCLDGTVINKNGTITGGQGKQARPGKNWEEAEAEALIKIRDDLIAQLEALGHEQHGLEDDLKDDFDLLETSLKETKEQLVCAYVTV
jgi:structural maintenance of chromosome 1